MAEDVEMAPDRNQHFENHVLAAAGRPHCNEALSTAESVGNSIVHKNNHAVKPR